MNHPKEKRKNEKLVGGGFKLFKELPRNVLSPCNVRKRLK